MVRRTIAFVSALVMAAVWLRAEASARSLPAQARGGAGEMTSVIIKFKRGVPVQAPTNPALAKLGLVVMDVPPERYAMTVADLKRDPAVEAVWPNGPVQALETPNDPLWPQQYGLVNIRLPQAWDALTTCLTVTIAVVDTGIDLPHPDLVDRLWRNAGETGGGRESNSLDDDGNGYIDDWQGWDFVNDDNAPQDDHGHGTHVAGIAAASTNNNLGVAGAAGLRCPAQLMPLKVLSASGYGEDADVASALVYAVDNGARVINLSLGDPRATPAIEIAIDYAVAQGALAVAAAGNSGAAGVYYPALYPNAIAVASTDASNARSFFSSYGLEVDLAAPGSNIYSTRLGNTYGPLSGTSMATPHVAGAAALLASQAQFDTPGKIRLALEYTALDLGPMCPDIYYGHGLIQVEAALQFDPAAAYPVKCFTHYLPLIGR